MDGSAGKTSPTAAARRGVAGDDDSVTRIVRLEVIPRLIEMRRRPAGAGRLSRARIEDDVDAMVRLSLAGDAAAAAERFAALREAAPSGAAVMESVLTPAARRLGDMWGRDNIGFADVTMACARLGAIVRRADAAIETAWNGGGPNALVATLARERHGLGAMVFAHGLREAGWFVCEAPGSDHAALRDLASMGRWDLIALSAGDAGAEDDARRALSAMRDAARPDRPLIAVGGPAVHQRPDFADAVGADFGGSDVATAIETAQALLSTKAGAATRHSKR